MKKIKRYKLDGELIEIEDTDRRRRWAKGKGFVYEMDPTAKAEAVGKAKAEKSTPRPADRPAEA